MIRRFTTQLGQKSKAQPQKNFQENLKKISQDEIFTHVSKDSSPGNNKIHIIDQQENQKDDLAYFTQQSRKSNSLLSETNHVTTDISPNQSVKQFYNKQFKQQQYDISDQFQVAEQRRLKSDHQKLPDNENQKKNESKEDILMEIFKLKEKLKITSLDEELAKFERKQIEKLNVSKNQLKNILEPKKNTLKLKEPRSPQAISPSRSMALEGQIIKPKTTTKEKPSKSTIQHQKIQSVERTMKSPQNKNINCFDKVNKFLKNSEEILIQDNHLQRKAVHAPTTPQTKVTLPTRINLKSVSPKRQFDNHIKIDMVNKMNHIKEEQITEIQRPQNSLPAAQKQEIKQYQFEFNDIDQLQFQNKEALELRKKALEELKQEQQDKSVLQKKALEEIKQEQQDKSTSTIDFLTDLDASLQIQAKNQTPLKHIETLSDTSSKTKSSQSHSIAQTEKKQQMPTKTYDKHNSQIQTAKPRDQQPKKYKLQNK